jgi:hypothetical protein
MVAICALLMKYWATYINTNFSNGTPLNLNASMLNRGLELMTSLVFLFL